MAEAMAVDEAVAEPFMPHVSLSAVDLDPLYPSVIVPEAVDADDGNDLLDQTLNESLKQSCDVYYYDIAQRVGIDKIAAMGRKLGLGECHDLPMSAMLSSVVDISLQ